MRFHLKHQFIHKNLFSIVYSLKGIILQNQDSVKLNFSYKSLPSPPTQVLWGIFVFSKLFSLFVREHSKNLLINKNNYPAHDVKPSKNTFTIFVHKKGKESWQKKI